MGPVELSILVVEDEVVIAQALTRHLAKDGHRVFWARDGQEAIARAADVQPDVVLLDIGLPDRDGYDVAHSLREPGGIPDTSAIVVLTGLPRATPTRQDEFVIDLHLMKPIAPHELSSLIHFAHRQRATDCR